MPRGQKKIVFKPFTGETCLKYQLNKPKKAVVLGATGNHKLPGVSELRGAHGGLKGSPGKSLKRKQRALDETGSWEPQLERERCEGATSGGEYHLLGPSSKMATVGSSSGSSTEEGTIVVYPQNMTIDLETHQATQNAEQSSGAEDEVSALTSQMAAARVYDRTRDRASGSSCLPKRVTNWDTFEEPSLLRSRLAPEEEFRGPWSEGEADDERRRNEGSYDSSSDDDNESGYFRPVGSPGRNKLQ